MILKWIGNQQILIISVCLIIIGVCLPIMLYANANLPELVQRNASDSLMLMLAAETKELGYDFSGAKEDHAYILRKYLGHMKKRNFSLLLRLLYPELSPRKQLTTALANLNPEELVTKQDQAKNEIKKVEETIKQFVSKSLEFSDIQILTFELEDLPEELLNDTKSALDDSRKHVEIYGNNLIMSKAQEACRKNRKAIALAYLVRCGYQSYDSLDDKLKQFRGDINRTIYYNHVLQGKKEIKEIETSEKDKTLLEDYSNSELRALLEDYSNSELRRLKVLQAILDKDIYKAHELLRKTIETSSKLE